MLNINVGLLGHVDSGKTTLAKALSEVASTASFDKHPQAQERGITIDLGFSSFKAPAPQQLPNYDTVQFTLVDCPGHASLISTVMGGAQIIDMILLIVDATKGVQTQTAECMVIAEIIAKKVIVVVNKTDLLENSEQEKKVLKKMRITVDGMAFKGCPIVTASGFLGKIHEVTDCLLRTVSQPVRDAKAPFYMALDHCFAIQGKGTVLTGTILQGSVQVNDEIEIPAIKAVKKVKSIQMFRKPVNSAHQGDRVGVCVTQFDPKLVERGIASKPGLLSPIYAVVLDMKRVRFYGKPIISRRTKFHITIGHETILSSVLLFHGVDEEFDTNKEYRYLPEYEKDSALSNVFGLLEFDRGVLIPPNAWIIGAKLDLDRQAASTCRMAFYGNVRHSFSSKNYKQDSLPSLKIFKEKTREGTVERVADETTLIGRNMFQKKSTNISKFLGMRMRLSTGEEGTIESAFGQSGKFKLRINDLNKSTIDLINKGKSAEDNEEVKIILSYKRFIFDAQKKMLQ